MLSIKLSENGGKAPEAVPYMPAGLQDISCTVDGRAGKRRVLVDSAACERLEADLQAHLAAFKAGEKARPVVLFDHKAGEAAAVPVGFEWDDERGILLRVEWTSAGREAVEGGNYGYVSPAFTLEHGSNVIVGLPDGVEVGSLVNDPAFERNECIAASRTRTEEVLVCSVSRADLPPINELEKSDERGDNKEAAEEESGRKQHNIDMETVTELLGLGADATPADIAAAVAELKKKLAELQETVDKVQAESNEHKKELEQHKEKAADGFVERLKKDGKVSPQDDETLKAAREMYLQSPEKTERIYASMKPVCPVVGKEEVHAGRVPVTDYETKSLADFYNEF